ncbi:hypothetical protein C8J57DRAFT_980466, partial [Mycena rebaudengoi]
DLGDDIQTATAPHYGEDSSQPLPPFDELENDPVSPYYNPFPDRAAERAAGVSEAKVILRDLNYEEDNGNWGINVYRRAL